MDGKAPDVTASPPAHPQEALLSDDAGTRRTEPFPLTDLQAAYFFAKSVGAGGVGCHTYVEFEVAALDLARLTDAWNRVVAHHPMLRMRVTAIGQQVIQADVPRYVIKGYRPQQFEHHIVAIRREMSHKLYSPGTWPLFDIRVSWCRDDFAIVHMSIDSWVLDGPSAGIVMEDFYALYENPQLRLNVQSFEFRDHVLRLHERRRSASGMRQRQFWRDKISASPPGPSLVAALNSAHVTTRFERYGAALDHATWGELKAFAARHGVFPASVVLACLVRTLAPVQHEDQFSILLTHSYRERFFPGNHRVVGPFASTSLCVAEGVRGRSIGELATSLHDQICESLDNQDVCVAGILGEQMMTQGGTLLSLPVVFTSNVARYRGLDRRRRSWLDHIIYAVSQTPSVALESRVSLVGGGVEIAWDVAQPGIDVDVTRTLFRDFETLLHTLACGGIETVMVASPNGLSPLQRVYLAERVRADAGPWVEGTVYQEFEVADLDHRRLESALNRNIKGEIRIWDPATGTLRHTLTGHTR